MSSTIKYFRQREIGQICQAKLSLETLSMDGWTFKTSADLRHILESFPNLRELHLNLCLGLVNETKAIVSAVVALHELQHIYLERTSFLTPEEVIYIMQQCPKLVAFHFSPVYVYS